MKTISEMIDELIASNKLTALEGQILLKVVNLIKNLIKNALENGATPEEIKKDLEQLKEHGPDKGFWSSENLCLLSKALGTAAAVGVIVLLLGSAPQNSCDEYDLPITASGSNGSTQSSCFELPPWSMMARLIASGFTSCVAGGLVLIYGRQVSNFSFINTFTLRNLWENNGELIRKFLNKILQDDNFGDVIKEIDKEIEWERAMQGATSPSSKSLPSKICDFFLGRKNGEQKPLLQENGYHSRYDAV